MKAKDWTVQQKYVVTHKNGSVLYFDDRLEVDMFLEGIDRGRSAKTNAAYEANLIDCICAVPPRKKNTTHSPACASFNTQPVWARQRNELSDSMEYPANRANGLDWEDF